MTVDKYVHDSEYIDSWQWVRLFMIEGEWVCDSG